MGEANTRHNKGHCARAHPSIVSVIVSACWFYSMHSTLSISVSSARYLTFVKLYSLCSLNWIYITLKKNASWAFVRTIIVIIINNNNNNNDNIYIYTYIYINRYINNDLKVWT